jgi:hypothetical protein
MLGLEPELVRLDRLADDPDAQHAGVYGRNPRFTASADWGRASVNAAAERLAARAAALLAGRELDTLADLRRFVACSWPEPLELSGVAPGATELGLHNPGRASRYVSGLDVAVDGARVGPERVVLVNPSPGETGQPVAAASLGPESGFYVRRGQTAAIRLPALPAGVRRVRLDIGLAGVEHAVVEAASAVPGAG